MFKNKKNNKSKTLFICMTPFQIYFASKIIEKECLGASATIFLIDLTNNDKNHKSLLQAKEKYSCQIFSYKECNQGKPKKLYYFLKYYVSNFSSDEFKDVFIASLHDKYIHIFIKLLKFRNLKSFDDGAANINKSGMFFHDKYINSKIKPRIINHYTIYKEIENIVDNDKIINIKLFNLNNNYNKSKSNNTIIFFIGQPYNEFFDGFDPYKFEKKLIALGVNIYIKHPREMIEFAHIHNVNTDEIFELYLEKFIEKNPEKSIKIYSYFSSVMFNLSSINGIKLVCLKNNELFEKYKLLYDLMPTLGISVEDDLI